MKLLILGARGMLGQALATVFTAATPTLWDKAELDITDAAAVRQQITQLAPTHIINAAAYTDVDGAENARALAWAINAEAVERVANIAQEIKAVIVHYSTDYVFPGDRPDGYREDDSPGPAVNVYGESKLAGEQALQASGASYYLVRTAWLYGAGGKNFVHAMLRLATSQSTLAVVGDQHGSPTYAADVAQATKLLLADQYTPGIYHLVNDGQATWAQFAQEIFKLKNLPIVVKSITSAEYVRPASRPTYSVLQHTRGPLMRHWTSALAEYLQT